MFLYLKLLRHVANGRVVNQDFNGNDMPEGSKLGSGCHLKRLNELGLNF